MAKVVISFTLDPEEDAAILQWLKRYDRRQRSAAIRRALRDHLTGGVTLGDVYQAVKDLERALERKLKAGVTVQDTPADDGWIEPPDAAAALDALGKL